MRTTRLPILLAILILTTATTAQQAPSADVALKAAMHRELVEGNLPAAIAEYKTIIARFPDNRPVAAKALIQLGMCYEKLGRSEARDAYSRLLRDYGDQTQQAKQARSRLTQLAGAAGKSPLDSNGHTFRKIDIAEASYSHQARVSPDSEKLLYIGVQAKEPRFSLRIADLASGKSHTLVEGIGADAATLIFEWSPDGKSVVYKIGRGELRVVGSDGGKTDVLWVNPEKEPYVYPLDWSEQNHAILIGIVDVSKNTVRLAMLPEKGGEPRTILSGDSDELNHTAQFSPDGRFIVGTKRIEKNIDVYVWAVDGGGEIRVTDHSADDTNPFWSPDGKYIVFVSNRAKTVDLWAVPMAGSRPSGDPARIQADIGENKIPSDFTRGGQLVFQVIGSSGRPSDLFVLPVDPKTGEARGSFGPFAKYPMQASFPRWSPDGSRLAYTSRKGNIQLPNAYVSSGGAGDELEIPARSYWMGNVEWSRDGKSLLFSGWNNDDSRPGIFRISLGDLTIEPVHPLGERTGPNWKGAYVNIRWLPLAGRYMVGKVLGETGEELYLMDPADYRMERVGDTFGTSGWGIPSPDGRYLIGMLPAQKSFALVSLPDGASRVLCPYSPEGWPAFAWSPDGTKLVWGEQRLLKMYSVVDGTIRTLVEAGQDQKMSEGLVGTPHTAWSPDGTKIAYLLGNAAPDAKARAELWVVEATGGSPRKIADAPPSHPLMSDVTWHPSGNTILVQARAPKGNEGEYEHWVMENFLPKPASAAGAKAK